MSRILMESGQKTGDDWKWEEDMGWSHFHTVQFCQILTGRFNQHLAIPNKFVNNVRKKLPENVVLQGPSGDMWNVGLTTFGSTLYFKNGWKEFVQDNALEENDVLIFKYTGNSRFDVLIFDRESLCEKESPHFMKRCKKENEELDGNLGMKDKLPPSSAEVSGMFSRDVSDESPGESKKHKRDDTEGATLISEAKPLLIKEPEGLAQRGLVYAEKLLHRKRLANNEKKEKALNEAIAFAEKTEASFVMNMIKTHVHTAFYVSIPLRWARLHLPCRSQYKYATLIVEDKTWEVKFSRKKDTCGLSGGWRTFAIENYLEESDVLVFSLVGTATYSVTFNVRIFRVVEKDILVKQVRLRPAASPRVIVGGLRRPQLISQRGITNLSTTDD